jgi:hypothetical protein
VPRQFTLVDELQLDELALYHRDTEAALRLYFSPAAPTFAARYLGEPPDSPRPMQDLESRLDESDVRSAFVVLTRLEATFRVDFDERCRQKLKDSLSRYFREKRRDIERRGGRSTLRLSQDILEGWKTCPPDPLRPNGALISELRSALAFRHWFAHGRCYRTQNFPGRYDYVSVDLLARNILAAFPFVN